MSDTTTVPSRLPEGGDLDPDRSSPQGKCFSPCILQSRQLLACVSATLTMCLVGTVYGWTTTSLLQLTTGTAGVPLRLLRAEYSWMISITEIGSIIGSLLAAKLADSRGRRHCLLVCSTVFTVGWYVSYEATSVRMLYFARLFLGIGVGIARTINPMYVSEVADVDIRGSLGTLIAVDVYTGTLLTCALGIWLSYDSLLLILVIISFISFFPNTRFPETPYFLVAKGLKKEARKSIAYYKNIDDPHRVEIELRALRAEARYELHPQSRYELNQQSRSDFHSQSGSELPPLYSPSLTSPSRSAIHQLATSEIHPEPTSEIHQPSTSEIHPEPTSQTHGPSPSEIHRSYASEIHRPSTSEIHRPSTSEIHRPSTSEKHSQSTGEIHQPSTSEIHRPSTSEKHSQSTSEIHRPSTSEIHRPSTSEIHRPSTSEIHRPSTSQIHRQSTSHIQCPSTSQIYRASTSQIHTDTPSETCRSSTIELHQRSTCEIHTGPTSETQTGFTSELQSSSRCDLRTQFNMDSQEMTDTDETYMDGTKQTSITKLQVILHQNYRKPLYIMLGLTMAQQLSGNFITMQYLGVLFSKITNVIDPQEGMILVQFVSFVSGSLIFFIVPFVGRKTLLLLSTGGTCITLIILAIYLSLFGNQLNISNVSIVPVIDSTIYQVMFEIGLGTLPNVLLCELFPTELKGFAGAVNVTFDATIGFIVTVLYKVFIDHIGSYTIYFIFATSCFLAFLMVFKWVPETKGKTYNEIEALLAGGNLNSMNEEGRTDEMELRRI